MMHNQSAALAAVGHKPEVQKQAATNKDPDYKALINSARTRKELTDIWNSIPANKKDSLKTLVAEVGNLKFPKLEAVQ